MNYLSGLNFDSMGSGWPFHAPESFNYSRRLALGSSSSAVELLQRDGRRAEQTGYVPLLLLSSMAAAASPIESISYDMHFSWFPENVPLLREPLFKFPPRPD
jgi:hypothetical protein